MNKNNKKNVYKVESKANLQALIDILNEGTVCSFIFMCDLEEDLEKGRVVSCNLDKETLIKSLRNFADYLEKEGKEDGKEKI
jgi:hypothetical protein